MKSLINVLVAVIRKVTTIRFLGTQSEAPQPALIDPSKYGKADCYEMARFWGISVQEAVERMKEWVFADYDQYDGEMLFHIPDDDLRMQVDQARFDGRLG